MFAVCPAPASSVHISSWRLGQFGKADQLRGEDGKKAPDPKKMVNIEASLGVYP